MEFSDFLEKTIKFSYKILCKIYMLIITYVENVIYLKKSKKRLIFHKGFFVRDLIIDNLEILKSNNKFKINNYLDVYNIKDANLEILIKNIFDKKFQDYITSITGFEYSIDYMIMYSRKFIPYKKRIQKTLEMWYSYKWHYDKPNSKNTLKIILPINISKNHGPLSMLDIESSRKISNLKALKDKNKSAEFIGNCNKLYGFLPALCVHKDGIPNEGEIATQIMFQLNPHKKWSVNKNLNRRQPNLNNSLKLWTNEPKFTFLSCMRDYRIELDNL